MTTAPTPIPANAQKRSAEQLPPKVVQLSYKQVPRPEKSTFFMFPEVRVSNKYFVLFLKLQYLKTLKNVLVIFQKQKLVFIAISC